jgi:membrane-bound serine protease (ClpP class)
MASITSSSRGYLTKHVKRFLTLGSGVLFLALPLGGQSPPPESPASAAHSKGPVYRIPMTGVVEMGLAPFISRSLAEAESAGASAAILDIDTPGGRIDAAEQIADAINDSPVPVYAFVNRRALSAGALIALATDGIYMRPGSTLGAATPVTGEGERASEKIVSAMRSTFRALAEARGLDPRIAEAMVDEQVEVPGLDDGNQLLTLSTAEAVGVGYADEAADWEALLEQLGVQGVEVETPRLNWAERVVRFFTNPLVAPFLLTLGFLGLLIEIKTPAFGLAGVAGAISLGLFFGSHYIIGLAGWEVAILLGMGLLLMLAEVFVLPGFGVAGVLGLLCLVASTFLSMVGRLPSSDDILIALSVLAGSFVLIIFTTWQLIKRLPKDRRGHQLFHLGGLTRERGYSSAMKREDLVGLEGVTLTDLRPAGVASVADEKIDVVSGGPWVAAGTPVRIVRSEGYRHVVEPF